MIPNLTIMAPKDEAELRDMLHTALTVNGPVLLRYPRGRSEGFELSAEPSLLPIGQGEWLRPGQDAVIVALGSRVWPAREAAEEIEAATGKSVAVYNARFVKPLPRQDLLEVAARYERIVLAEENALAGGFGSAVLEL